MRSSLAGILCSLTALNWASSVAADYYVDHANNTVAYAASGTIWQTFSFATQNITFVLGNGNVTVDSFPPWQCPCRLYRGEYLPDHISFHGIWTFSICCTSSGQSVTATLPPPTPPSYQTPNVLLFDLQSLLSADHTATINLLDWQNGTTSLYFDYALINESHVENPVSPPTTSPPITSMTTTLEMLQSSTIQSTTASFTSLTSVSTFIGSSHTSGTSSTASNAKHRVNLSVVVGGACGGLAVLVAIVTAILFFKKRRLRHIKLEKSRRPDPFPVAPVLAHDQIVSSRGHPTMSEKMHVRLAARNFSGASTPAIRLTANRAPSPSFRPSDMQRAVAAETGPSTRVSSMLDARIENTPSSTAQVGPTPGYQALEDLQASHTPL